MITPFQAHDALLADVEAARQQTSSAHLWWLGQSGFLLQWQGKHLLFDPYLSDALTKKYENTDRPHVRMTDLVVSPSRLDFIDVVTSSHNHTDHLDAETIRPLLERNPQMALVVGAANHELAAQRLSLPPDRLIAIDAGQSTEVAGFTIHAVPAAHEELERDDSGHYRFLGFVVEFGGRVVYHSGDTIRFEGMVERLRQWSIDVALLPINGRLPERGVVGNLWGREAALLAADIDARVVIPCHYEMFEFNTVSPDEFVAAARDLGQDFRVLLAGERYSW